MGGALAWLHHILASSIKKALNRHTSRAYDGCVRQLVAEGVLSKQEIAIIAREKYAQAKREYIYGIDAD